MLLELVTLVQVFLVHISFADKEAFVDETWPFKVVSETTLFAFPVQNVLVLVA